MIVRHADYDFASLKDWRDSLLGLFSRNDVFTLDIDERIDRLRLGVRDGAAIAAARAEIAARGIPGNAVTVEIQPRPERRISLTDYTRPLVPGFKVSRSDGSFCTLGFNARRTDGTRVFVSASHCSGQIFAPDGAALYQPYFSSGYYIGSEIVDPPYQSGCYVQGVGAAARCRRSDAALWAYDASVSDDFGHVAHTLYPGVGAPGSLDVDPANPYYTIGNKADINGVPVGFWINKVGVTSGWTRGQVTQSCVVIADYPANLICQDVAQLYSDHGDSGSPVYVDETQGPNPSGTLVQLVGLLWGGPYNDRTITFFSPTAMIEGDLGTLLVCAPGVPWTC